MTSPNIDPARLDGKIALITGGGSGIGEAVAKIYANAGAHVIVAGRRAEQLKQVARAIGGTALTCDVTQPCEVVELFKSANEIAGHLDVLVNNAGIPGPIGPVSEVDMDSWRACLEVNLFGAMNCMQEASRIMGAQQSGTIINMSSLMGIQGYPMRSAYCASKFALVGISEALARELGPMGVRVNTLLPGAVSGENMDRILSQRAESENRPIADIVRENYTDSAALRRWVDPEEVGRAALYLASDLSSATTGETIKVDCGRF
jgi:NAD(P)-dependent dehydrogenase (short-subunit alcohol dehydrogenase family)